MWVKATRVMAALGRVMITAGVVVLLFVGYQLWATNLKEARAQNRLESSFEDRLRSATTTPTTTPTTAPPGTAPAEPAPAPTTTAPPMEVEPGEALARIEAPSIGLNKVVVEGVRVRDLQKGPGRYSRTAMPGHAGNVGIAGHRTTYGAPFGDIDKLQPGDEIVLTDLYDRRFVYEVMPAPDDPTVGHFIVAPRDVWVLDDFGDHRLTLTSCHPRYSARQRIIVVARLMDPPTPIGAATTTAAPAPPGPDEERPPEDDPVLTPGAGGADEDPVGTPGGGHLGDDVDPLLVGDDSARAWAVAWGVVFSALVLAAATLGRRFGRRFVYPAAAIPLLVVMWVWFEQVDRWLPAR